jgi:hypothetical protein
MTDGLRPNNEFSTWIGFHFIIITLFEYEGKQQQQQQQQ